MQNMFMSCLMSRCIQNKSPPLVEDYYVKQKEMLSFQQ